MRTVTQPLETTKARGGDDAISRLSPMAQASLQKIFAGFDMTPEEQDRYLSDLLGIIGTIFDAYFADLRADEMSGDTINTSTDDGPPITDT